MHRSPQPFADRNLPGVLVGTGDLFTSAAGRHLAPAPRIDTTTDRRCTASLKRLKAWLCEEAVAEARFRVDIFNLPVFLRLRADALSMSDLDSLNAYLFANVNGPPADLKRSAPPRPGATSTQVRPARAVARMDGE